MNDRGLAVRLRAYDIVSKNIRVGEWHGKGYAKEDFYDSWERYLPSPPCHPLHPLHPLQPLHHPRVTATTSATTSVSI